MSQSSLADALATGTTIVTPNNRLAREVTLRFDAACRAAGKRAWTPAQAMPWTMWLERLRLSALANRSIEASVLLDASATRESWHRLVAADRPSLLNKRGAARHAADAWTLFHAFREAGEGLQRIAARGGDDDAAMFGAWAERYRLRMHRLDAIDSASLPDVLAAGAASRSPWATEPVLLYGFTTLTPQQQRLVAALRDAGRAIGELPPRLEAAPVRYRVACATPAQELAQALGFARARLVAEPQARIAIVVADLEERRDEVVALAEEILCPAELLALHADIARPYGVSLGEPLAAVPIVCCALAFIALAAGDVDAPIAASALRAPFLPDASRWTLRADAERCWRDEGRRSVGWNDVLATLRRLDAPLHQRFAAAIVPGRAARLPREWARAWSDWLTALGWPGNATLTSAQWQAREAWSAALARFASNGMITGALTVPEALEALRALITETLWAPQASPAPIQILGVLEAAGLSFDCAWLAGFDAHRWPPAAAPNPFLPLGWQRARGVTRSHPETALANAERLTSQLAALAREVVVSHAEQIDDAPSTVSPLFAAWPRLARADFPVSARYSEAIAPVEPLSAVDDTAPAPAPGERLRGGAQVFESHSACPFQAFARFRLRADAWDACPEGLSARERGIVLHAVLKAFWDDVRDHATLDAIDAAGLARRIAAAVDSGKAKLAPARWRALPPAIATAESQRLRVTIAAWLDEAERGRPPFRVRSHEQSLACDVEGLGVRVRIDRIDELDGGGIAIIDYKSGRVFKPARWFAPRPQGIQLAVYAHGVECTEDSPVRALAYAQVRAGDVAVSGIADTHDAWPALDVPGEDGRVPARTWDEARQQLRARLVTLANGIRGGDARVAPRDGATCQYCALKPLCRIQVLDDAADARAASDA
jgi:probable DNA repair protein